MDWNDIVYLILSPLFLIWAIRIQINSYWNKEKAERIIGLVFSYLILFILGGGLLVVW